MSDIESCSEGLEEYKKQSNIEKIANVNLLENSSNKKPVIHNAFQVSIVKKIMRSVLQQVLQGKSYSPGEVGKWTKQIADEINVRIKGLVMRHYKHVIQVTLVHPNCAGSQYIARCRWDDDYDSQISDYFINANIVCVVSVFGIRFC